MQYDQNQYGWFNPYGSYPQPSMPQNTSSRTINSNTYAFVNGIEGAKSFIVPANQTILLMDNEQPVCYMKQSNALGQSILRYFKLSEVSESDIRNINNQQQLNLNYATKDELKGILERLDKLENKQ